MAGVSSFPSPSRAWVRTLTVFNLTDSESPTGNRVRVLSVRFVTGCGYRDSSSVFEKLASGNAPIDNVIVSLPYNPNTLTISVGDYVQIAGETNHRRVNSVTYTQRRGVNLLLTDRMDI